MPVVLTKDDEGARFFIDLGDGTGSEGVYVTPMLDSEKEKLRRKFITKRVTRFGAQEETDAAGFYHARLKHLIKDWKGFVDLEGKAIPCTPENIVMLAEMNTLLFMEIVEKSERLAVEGRIDSEKN